MNDDVLGGFNPRSQSGRSAPIPIANRIDELCDRFEVAWKSSARPTIQEFLDETVSQYLPILFSELVQLDIEYRTLRGESADVDDYIVQFPQFKAVLSSIKTTSSALSHDPCRPPLVASHRYEIISELGEGGFGVVWKARDKHLNRLVAIKVPKSRLTGVDLEKSFLREARSAAELDHANIVSILDSGSEEGATYIVSRYVEGVDLRQVLKERTFTAREVAQLCASLAEALEYARVKGVIHRDLKPANILIDKQGQPHITDFGLATRRIDGQTIDSTLALAGTPAYMSPEQVRGQPRSDHRTDVYSLGVTLYELLTGRLPFCGDQATVLHHVLDKEPVPPRQHKATIPKDLEAICLKAMEKYRNDRYQTAGQLAEDLKAFLNGGNLIHARRAGIFASLRRWRRRNSILTNTLAVVAVAVLLSIALTYQFASAVIQSPGLQLRTVNLSTEPAGARLVCYRLNPHTGEPIPTDRTEASTRSPARIALSPGDYLIVAALDDGRFHEVYRHVPDERERLPVNWRHRYWQQLSDRSLFVERIVIPESEVVDGMALVPGSPRFRGLSITTETASLPSIYVDPREFTVAEYRRINGGDYPYDRRYQRQPDSFALAVDFELATSTAERVGKRLPTSSEYELVGSQLMPLAGLSKDYLRISEVGGIPDDRTGKPPYVYGLISNVAEWTMTSVAETDPAKNGGVSISGFVANSNQHRRIVRGRPSAHAQHDPLRKLQFVSPTSYDSTIGFRCVRSAVPRLDERDFHYAPPKQISLK